MTAKLQRAKWFFGAPLIGMLSVFTPNSGQTEAADRPTVWVEVVTQTETIDQQLLDALAVRLPERSVRSMPEGDFGEGCPESKQDDVKVVLHIDAPGAGRLTVRGCSDGAVLFEDPIPAATDSEDLNRRAAVTAATALDGYGERATTNKEKSGPPATDVDAPLPTREPVDVPKPARTAVRLSLAPGAAVTFGGSPLFRGSIGIGARFINGLGLSAAADFSSRVRGQAIKKNETPDEGVEAGVTDFGFRLGVFYRHPFSHAWFYEVGGGLGYTHSKTEDLSDEKYDVITENPAAQGAAFLHGAIGRALSPHFSLDLRVTPTVSFGKRRYTVRGEEALSMGYGCITLGVGAVLEL